MTVKITYAHQVCAELVPARGRGEVRDARTQRIIALAAHLEIMWQEERCMHEEGKRWPETCRTAGVAS